MSLCPSNMFVQGKAFPNYAGRDDVDELLKKELTDAGIEPLSYECLKQRNREVKTSVVGELGPWYFERAWYYWTAKGPGIPPNIAMELYRTHGKVVRVSGDCTGPSPLEIYKGFGVGSYHVDTADGLKALADTIRGIMEKAKNHS